MSCLNVFSKNSVSNIAVIIETINAGIIMLIALFALHVEVITSKKIMKVITPKQGLKTFRNAFVFNLFIFILLLLHLLQDISKIILCQHLNRSGFRFMFRTYIQFCV